MSKVIDEPEILTDKKGMLPLKLANGKQAYYQEDETSQSIWWESENGFLARFVYYINGNQEPLDENTLTQSELIDLASQVQ